MVRIPWRRYAQIVLAWLIALVGTGALADGDAVACAGPAPGFEPCQLKGRVKFVNAFPDYKIQFVNAFPDAKVKFVESFPDKAGRWKVVESFPDFTVQVVDAFPDFKIKVVDAFPGCK